MTGVQALREAIAQKTERLYGYQPDADSDITVTAGATEALYAAITALVRNGDEVICFDPSYDSYAPAIALSGNSETYCTATTAFSRGLAGICRIVKRAHPTGDPQHPHNPSATVWQQADFAALWQAIAGHEILSLAMKFTSTSTFHNRAMPACRRIRSCVSGRWQFLHLARPII